MVNLYEQSERLHDIAAEVGRARAILTLLVKIHPQGDESREDVNAYLDICDQVQQMACEILKTQLAAMGILGNELVGYFDTEEVQDLVREAREIDHTHTTVEALWQFLTRPDAREILGRERELLRAEGSTLLDPRPQDEEATT